MAFLGTQASVFMIMVFVAVVALAASVIVPTVGTEAQASKRMKRRIGRVLESIDSESANLLRLRRQDNMSDTERFFDSLPGMTRLRELVEQSGINKPAYIVMLNGIFLALVTFAAIMLLFKQPLVASGCAFLVLWVPILQTLRKRAVRLAKFEEQLPEALDLMSRALQAGHPFNETLKMVHDEMADPIASEFERVFTDINYGLPVKTAFISLLSRVPSMSLNTLVTAVLIQNESGGKIAEILAKIAEVIRSRFKLQRKVRTLSAEGRMSAWVLTLLPFVLTIVIQLTTPSYLPRMLDDPLGPPLVYTGFGLIMLGIFWMRKIIRFKF